MEQHKQCGNAQALDSINSRHTHSVRSQVQVDQGTTEWFPIQKRLKQGCILSRGQFNQGSVNIIKTGGIGDMVTGIGKVT